MTKKEEELYEERLSKLQQLRALGAEPYPAESRRSHIVVKVLEDFSSLLAKKTKVTLTGRIRALRAHGKISFGNLEDESGKIQFAVKANVTERNSLEIFQYLDVGDFIEITGTLFTTQKGEKTVLTRSLQLLAKSLRALPEKYHGLKDVETRLRKRYLDLLANPEVKELFQKKAVFWQTVREFLRSKGFLEVQTPVLEEVPGGADAEPFITHHNALKRDFYLRISLELPLKRLLIGGFEKVFEIGRLFRNEGIDREHLQEYDDMEFYWAYADSREGMALAESLFKEVLKKVVRNSETQYEGQKINWISRWPEIDYFESFKQATGIDLNDEVSLETLKKAADKLDVKYQKTYGKGRLIDALFKKKVRPKLIQPCFLVGQPIEISPLSKKDPQDPKKVLRFQVMAAGTELGNGWAELNDPQDQRARFEEQMKLRAAGDREAQRMDEDFIEALEYGMPPAVGFGMSERLFAVLMDKSIRETVIFPPMKGEK